MFSILAWLQLFTSLFLATTIVWGYVTYQSSLGQLLQSVAASISAISNVVARTAETVEARADLLDQTAQLLATTRNLTKELRTAAENQAKTAPQYAEGVRSAASLVGKLSGTFQKIGDGMLFSAPSGIRWEAMKPVVVMSIPLEKSAQALKANADELQNISASLSGVATTISRDGQNIGAAVIATSDQTLKVIAAAEETLSRIKAQDLPKALADLRVTSSALSTISAEVNIIGNLGLILLIVGLTLAAWCFVHSLGTLILAGSQAKVPATIPVP